MKIVAILQARMNSTRLPGKVLLPLAGKPMVQNIIERVRRATKIDDIVLAVPNPPHPEFAVMCNGRAWLYAYPGDENDLVGRYLAAAQAFDADVIVRVPCDNPCIDPVYIDQAIDGFLQTPSCFFSNTTASNSGQFVDGIGAEVYSRFTWQYLDAYSTMREHPHEYFYRNALFSLPRSAHRLDVNTQEDYAFIADIYDHFGHNRFTTEEVMDYLHMKETTHATQERVQQARH